MSWRITPTGPASLGLLDQYGGAAAAYSLRNLSIYNASPVVRVRRSSDNTESDFTATQVSDGTLTTFCGAGNGFVQTWYDQSGNGRNAQQTTTDNQPQIVSSGSLLTDNLKPCVLFNGSNDSLRADALASSFIGQRMFISAAMVCRAASATPTATGVVYGLGNSTTNTPLRWFGQKGSVATAGIEERGDTGSVSALLTGTIASQTLAWVNSNANNQIVRLNTSQVNATTGSNANYTLNTFAIGCLSRTADITFWNGNIQELIFYASDAAANVVPIEANINAYYAIY
jgi:hypothetical protein